LGVGKKQKRRRVVRKSQRKSEGVFLRGEECLGQGEPTNSKPKRKR